LNSSPHRGKISAAEARTLSSLIDRIKRSAKIDDPSLRAVGELSMTDTRLGAGHDGNAARETGRMTGPDRR